MTTTKASFRTIGTFARTCAAASVVGMGLLLGATGISGLRTSPMHASSQHVWRLG